jgi:hypothetical protein
MKRIPISAAKEIAHKYGYDQVIIIGRAVGEGEHVTTYGRDKAHCAAAAKIGDFLKHRVMGWVLEQKVPRIIIEAFGGRKDIVLHGEHPPRGAVGAEKTVGTWVFDALKELKAKEAA